MFNKAKLSGTTENSHPSAADFVGEYIVVKERVFQNPLSSDKEDVPAGTKGYVEDCWSGRFEGDEDLLVADLGEPYGFVLVSLDEIKLA